MIAALFTAAVVGLTPPGWPPVTKVPCDAVGPDAFRLQGYMNTEWIGYGQMRLPVFFRVTGWNYLNGVLVGDGCWRLGDAPIPYKPDFVIIPPEPPRKERK